MCSNTLTCMFMNLQCSDFKKNRNNNYMWTFKIYKPCQIIFWLYRGITTFRTDLPRICSMNTFVKLQCKCVTPVAKVTLSSLFKCSLPYLYIFLWVSIHIISLFFVYLFHFSPPFPIFPFPNLRCFLLFLLLLFLIRAYWDN